MPAADLLDDLLAQAYAGLTTKPARRVVSPGDEVPWDDLCGQLWVRVVSVSAVYGSAGAGSICVVGARWTLGLGLIRCVATLDDNGVVPSQAQVTADAARIVTDADELLAVLEEWTPEGRVTIGEWKPLGPQGGAAGGEWTLTVLR